MQKINNDEVKEADFTNENKITEAEVAAPKKQPQKKKTTSSAAKNSAAKKSDGTKAAASKSTSAKKATSKTKSEVNTSDEAQKPKRVRKTKTESSDPNVAFDNSETQLKDNEASLDLSNEKTEEIIKADADKDQTVDIIGITDASPTDAVSEPISEEYKEDEINDKNDKDIAKEPTEEKNEGEKSVDVGEDKHFILPEQATFFVTDPTIDPDTLFPAEDNVSESKNSLLNVEHFSDYKRKAIEDKPDNDCSEDTQDAQDVTYESITILDNEDITDVPLLQPKQKYEDPDRERYNPEKPRRVDGRFDFLELFVFTLLAVILMTTFVFRHSVVEGSSMQKTLEEGDHLIISDLFYTPKKGDIIVCQDRATGHDNPVVKRVIATEGDTIEILPDGKVFVNDKIIDESAYVYTDLPDTYPGLAKTLVPEDMVFVMGDHRNKSSDSRYFDSVFVREDAILGKVILRFYPFKDFGTVR